MEVEKILNLIISNKKDLQVNLALLKVDKKQIQGGVFVGKNVDIESFVFFDTSGGEIVIGDNTKVKAHAVLRGPLSIGQNCVINSFADIAESQIRDVCKIGGEVHSSIISSYSNKQHYGSIAHSYVGSWVNIGAGTSVSDLKNTYGPIKMMGKDTGEQFLGAIIGDYVKTAINTSIFCGKVIGEATHLYGMVTEDVPAFTSYVSGKKYELPIDIATKIQKAMTARRGVEFTDEDQKHIEKLFVDTAPDREKAKATKEKLNFK